ncbi:hypothetical protein EMPS_08146 [Entomortierella parvispora]|uniref:Uncharacterized protein n=1 Tax=Entomortierella parvispora TaxID=205924 RepID=A0A9P3LZ43_9FUNG|nr:hypothetical protein EMPS_08146 [Entomortierella parvispora]
MSRPQGLTFEALGQRTLPLSRPKVFSLDPSENEDMMTDACTPPLDLGSDSGEDDYCTEMRSPSSPPSVNSIPHFRKRKDSREHLSTAHHLFDRNQELQLQPPNRVDDRFFAPPSLGKTNGAQGRRPTVTFEVDSIPTAGRRCHFRHDDDDDDDDALDSDRDESECQDDTDYRDKDDKAVPDSLLQAERALRCVSLTPLVDLAQEPNCADNEKIDSLADEPTLACSTDSTASITSALSSSTTANADESSLSTETGPLTTTSTTNENSAPKEIILNHILTEAAPQDMLVALIDRSSELEALAAFHSDFFRLLYASISSSSREAFKTLLFSPRSQICDKEWMQTIASEPFLLGHPCLLEKFKALVGWIGPDGDVDDESDVQLWGEDEYCYRDSSLEQVQIKWLRDLEDFPIETFEEYYPQFFINAREKLQGRRMSHGGDNRDHYVIFRETLQLSRKELACDNAWTRRMNGCLEKHPELLLQLKEIVAYEVGYDD